MKMTSITLSSGFLCTGLLLGALGLATPAEAYQKHILEGIKWALGMGTWNLAPTKKIE